MIHIILESVGNVVTPPTHTLLFTCNLSFNFLEKLEFLFFMLLHPRAKYFLYLIHKEQTKAWVYYSLKACIPLNSSLTDCVGQ